MARHREIWVLPHQYSCGGYYLAERWQKGTLKGVEYDDNLNFWLLSGRQVLSGYQVEQTLQYCYDRGEVVTVVKAHELPQGARFLNLRNYC
jgi:hypothetical protein